MSEIQLGLIPDFSDLSNADDPIKEIKGRFYKSAEKIMLGYDLVCRGQCPPQITALELYLFHPELWPDDSTDKDKEGVQLERGRWYVKTRGFRSQWRIDITAGIKAKGIYAGMLIAAVGKEDGCGNALYSIIHGTERKHEWKKYNEQEILEDSQ
jgi:hypothetical protein